MAQPRTKPRAREVVIAVAIGGAAALGAASILFDSPSDERVDNDRPALVQMESSKTYEVGSFEQIALVGPEDVVVTIGDTPSVRAEGSPEALAELEVVVEDGALQIRPKEGFHGNWSDSSNVTFYVTVPRLDEFVLGGSGDARIDRIEGDRFEGTIAGPGELRIGAMKVTSADFNVVGAGSLVVAGTADDVSIKIAAAGDVDAKGLRSKTAALDIAGAGDVAMTVEDRARISLVGTGDVDITGGAQCTLSRFGVGEVTCNGVEIAD